MGFIDDQIKERRERDDHLVEDSYAHVAGAVLGNHWENHESKRKTAARAVDQILRYYHRRPIKVPDDVDGQEERLDYRLRPHGIMRRQVRLTQGWYKESYGPILGCLKESGRFVALMPGMFGGYYWDDYDTGIRTKVNWRNVGLFEEDAYCFYEPLPQRSIGIPDLLLYMKRRVSLGDAMVVVCASLAVTLVGMLLPQATKALTGMVLQSGSVRALMGIGICLACTTLASQLMQCAQGLAMARLETKTSIGVQASMMMRIMSLPPHFFKRYSAGELKSRSMAVNQLCSLFLGIVMNSSLSSLGALLYVTQIMQFAPSLVIPALVTIFASAMLAAVTTDVKRRLSQRQRELGAKESGLSYAIISGVQKLKLTGAEKRFFARWLDVFSRSAEIAYNPPLLLKVNGVLSTAISLTSSVVIYFIAGRVGIDQSSYFAFNAAYGSVMAAFMSLSSTALSAAEIGPILTMAEPFLKACPEESEGKEIVSKLYGTVALEHVSFRYDVDMPYIFQDLTLKIRAGEYVAIVGRTGCGKSTLMRLLLGFEKPERGVISYDGKDMSYFDLSSLRRKIGSVTQSGGLFQGDIYSNIVMSAPWLSVADAWDAAEKACIADDIRAMPMGMNTVIGEGCGGLSGGQRQRLMIARAIAPKPRLLILDEATSALDNVSQRKVSDALAAMGCTRIVIAHRLSTIRHCDRILVLDGGRVVEEGTYDELVTSDGLFATLAERQRLERGERR